MKYNGYLTHMPIIFLEGGGVIWLMCRDRLAILAH